MRSLLGPDRCMMEPGECGRCMGLVLYHETQLSEHGVYVCSCRHCRKIISKADRLRRMRKR